MQVKAIVNQCQGQTAVSPTSPETVILTLEIDADLSGSGALVNNVITYNLIGFNHSTTVVNSLIGTTTTDATDQLIEFLETNYLLPVYAQLGTAGVPLPTMTGVTYSNQSITLSPLGVEVGMDASHRFISCKGFAIQMTSLPYVWGDN